MQIIYPPNAILLSDINIFLAGTIDMGNSVDWQQDVINDFIQQASNENITIFNPKRI